MPQKTYEKPSIQKVKLSIRDAILATCHSSPNMTPADPDCSIPTDSCHNPPG